MLRVLRRGVIRGCSKLSVSRRDIINGEAAASHFCYACGRAFARTVVRGEIQAAMAAHYGGGRCQLYREEDVLWM